MTTTDPVEELRARARAFFAGIDDQLAGIEGTEARARAYQRALQAAGLVGIDIPVEYGGQGLDLRAKAAVAELARMLAPPEAHVFTIGLGMAVPTIMSHAAESLRARYVPPALDGREIWCQMYSEPGAGSDLAGLQTRATRTEDGWILQGQKVWTSHAQIADVAICLARTDIDQPKHKGLTMFVVPMDLAGITVRPIVQITGDSEFNEVFLDGVAIPADHVIGEVGDGWRVAVSLLQNERSSIGSGGGRQPVPFDRLRDLVVQRGRAQDPLIRDQLVDVFIGQRLAALFDEYQAEIRDAGGRLGAESSLGKLWRSDNGRAASDLIGRLAYADATAWHEGDERDEWTFALLDACALPLGGGTDEIQKNAIAEQVLRLPRDPFNIADVPFRDLKVGNQSVSGASRTGGAA